MSAKSAYVGALHGVRRAASHVGLPEQEPGRRGVRAHLRSLLDIHDSDALIRWDVPWWTYRAVDAVDSYLSARDRARVFEFGSGASTVWLARRSAEVHTVEHDLGWADLLRPKFDDYPNVTLHTVPPTTSTEPIAPSGRRGCRGLDFDAYVRTIDEVGGNFDLVVVDGRARMACLQAALRHLAADGVVVVDNTKRRRYQQTLNAVPMHITRLRGAAPGLPYSDETSLLTFASASPAQPATARTEGERARRSFG